MFLSKQKPGIYDPVKIEVIKSRIPAIKIRSETEKEATLKKEATKKNNDPSPCTYKAEESYDKTQGKKSFKMKISNSQNLKFTGNDFLLINIFRSNNKAEESYSRCRSLRSQQEL